MFEQSLSVTAKRCESLGTDFESPSKLYGRQHHGLLYSMEEQVECVPQWQYFLSCTVLLCHSGLHEKG